jgi:hypothetical protein
VRTNWSCRDPSWAHTTTMLILMPMQKLCNTFKSLPPPSRKVVKTPLPPTAAMIAPSVPLESLGDDPSVFQVPNIFRYHWFLNRDHLIANILAAQKDKSSRIHWVDFQPNFHTYLVHQAITLLSPLYPLAKGKHYMFISILEVLTIEESGSKGSRTFFHLPKKTS